MATKGRGKAAAAAKDAEKKAKEAEKKAKDAEKKALRKVEEEEAAAAVPVLETKQAAEEPPPEKVESTAAVAAEETSVEEEAPAEEQPPPETVYEEPILIRIIVERYEGEKVKGLYDGEGEAFFYGGNHYKGQFSEGLMHGNGTYTWADGVNYTGDFVKNHITGNGVYVWKDGSCYEGEVMNGIRHGSGVMTYANGMIYAGNWISGKQSGKGRLDYDSLGKSFYDGDWSDNVRHGFGKRCYPSGNVYVGTWYKNIRHGEGTMIWHDQCQSYSGQWDYGVQNGIGEWVWYQRRGIASQYSMNNAYRGQICNGLRLGFGIFYYANGARYEGEWKDNVKCGKGKFIFKNGRVYEGEFRDDHIVEFPQFEMDGRNTPDMSMIRTRTPLPSERVSVNTNTHGSTNTFSPSFQLRIDHLLMKFEETDREEESTQVLNAMLRHMTSLHRIYSFYSRLGMESSCDSTFLMTQMQFWRFLKDCKLHHCNCGLTDMDRWLADDQECIHVKHNPNRTVLFREFLNSLIVLAYHLYQADYSCYTGQVLASCFSRLMTGNVLRNACTVQGYIFDKPNRAENVLVHQDALCEVYKALCSTRPCFPPDDVLTMRQFVIYMKDMHMLNNDLTAKAIVDILASDDPRVRDQHGALNLELEMGFLDFLEALVGCAEVYVTEAVLKDPSVSHLTFISQKDGGLSIVEKERNISDSRISLVKELQAISSRIVVPVIEAVNSKTVIETVAEQKSRETTVEKIKIEASNEEMVPLDDITEIQLKLEETENLIPNYSFITSQTPGDRNIDFGPTSEISIPEETRQFNFWTHQIHIFFIKKFFPAYDHLLEVKSLVRQAMDQSKNASCMASIEPNIAGS